MELAIAILSSSVIASIISGIFQIVNNKRNKQSKLEKGICLLLLAAIREDGQRLCDQGKVSQEEYNIFIAEYNAYKALGGDGWADGVHDHVNLLKRDFT